MEFIKKIINKIRSLLGLKNKKLLMPHTITKDIENSNHASSTHVELLHESNSIDSSNHIEKEIENLEYSNIEDFTHGDKKEFFKIYEEYKSGNIKEENLFIADLINIELMMIKETILLEKKIDEKKEIIKNQEIKLSNLLQQKSSLETKIQL